jgi:hypothetical protein
MRQDCCAVRTFLFLLIRELAFNLPSWLIYAFYDFGASRRLLCSRMWLFCIVEASRRFRATCCIHHEGIHPPWWWQQVPMKHRYSYSITKNTVLFTVTTMKASDLTYSSLFINPNARRTFFIRQLALFFAQTVSLFQFAVGFTKNVLEFILGFCSAYLKVMEMYFLRLAHRRRIILLVHGTYIEVL